MYRNWEARRQLIFIDKGNVFTIVCLLCREGRDFVEKRRLRIPDSYHGKTLKNHTPLVRYASYFFNQAIFQKFERRFFD